MIRLARPEDAPALAAVYAPCVTGTAVTFELQPPDAAEMAARLARTLPAYPWLVIERAGEVAGYAYAGAFAQRPCYRWSVATSIYLHRAHWGQGLGRRLYTALLQVLAAQGFRCAYAGITLPHPASEGLHRALGFEPVGTYREAGHKLGRWHDVAWVQRSLQPGTPRDEAAPPEPLPAPPVVARLAAGWGGGQGADDHDKEGAPHGA